MSRPLGWITATAYQVLVRHGKADCRYSQFFVLNKSETHARSSLENGNVSMCCEESREREKGQTIEQNRMKKTTN